MNDCITHFMYFIFRVTTVSICEDSSLISVGFSDSTIRVFTLTPNKLRAMKSGEDLEIIDRDSGLFCSSVLKNINNISLNVIFFFSVMAKMFKQCLSTIPPIPAKQTIIAHRNSLNTNNHRSP